MRARIAVPIAVVVAAAAVTAVLLLSGGEEGKPDPIPGLPTVSVISPRDGSKHEDNTVVVKLDVDNFRLAPRSFEGAPLLGEGHIRFSLNKVPEEFTEDEEEEAASDPLGSGRLIGRSFDYARNAGPNGLLARRIGEEGSYSPATKPEIFYQRLPEGFYRLVVTLAQNDGSATPFHTVTHFRME